MRKLTAIAACCSAAAACVPHPPIHDRPVDLAPNEWVWCLAPNGAIQSVNRIGHPSAGEQRETCEAPGSFVRVPICDETRPGHDETPAVEAARAHFAKDRSLHGDRFDGREFCIPTPPS